jgi:beta-glucuronidase
MKKSNLILTALLTVMAIGVHSQDFKTASPENIALYPQQNEFRNAVNLSGIWNFKKDPNGVGEKEQWYNGLADARSIAVPGSYNEQLEDIRDYLGYVWYEKTAFVTNNWKGQNIYIRVGSANYAAKVWVNGKAVGKHNGGHLPFAFDITAFIIPNADNVITIQTENELKPTRVPTGNLIGSGGMFSNFPKTNFDFFPYGGLQRAVWLYSTPVNAINDVTVNPTVSGTDGELTVTVLKTGNLKNGKIKLSGNNTNAEASFVFNGNQAVITLKVAGARLWNTADPFLYNLEISTVGDVYRLPVGMRSISVTNKQILLNGKPVFLKGFGKHEDFPVFGRGLAEPVMVKDYSLLKWVGANSYRTSHYPYDEEYMMMADREGILIIDEIPAVGLFFQDGDENINTRKEVCKQQIRELITRDKNHPSVIMWSLANEPFSKNMNFGSGIDAAVDEQSLNFFKELYSTAKAIDKTRPVTIVGVQGGPSEWLGVMDVICINRYYGWYTQQADIAAGAKLLGDEMDALHAKYNKPVVVTEFGADAYPGMHTDQPEMFTEEFQKEFIKAYLDVADQKDFVAGMHIWAFADFKTSQGIIRFGGMNYKGVFTRDRKPKLSAYYLRSRWAGK